MNTKLSTSSFANLNASQRLARTTLTTGIQKNALACVTLKHVKEIINGLLWCAHAYVLQHHSYANVVMSGTLIAVHVSLALIKVSATLKQNSTTLCLANVNVYQLAAKQVRNGGHRCAHAVIMFAMNLFPHFSVILQFKINAQISPQAHFASRHRVLIQVLRSMSRPVLVRFLLKEKHHHIAIQTTRSMTKVSVNRKCTQFTSQDANSLLITQFLIWQSAIGVKQNWNTLMEMTFLTEMMRPLLWFQFHSLGTKLIQVQGT